MDAVIAEAYNEASVMKTHMVFMVAWSTAGGQAQPVPTWEPESNLAGAQEAITNWLHLRDVGVELLTELQPEYSAHCPPGPRARAEAPARRKAGEC